MRFSVLLPTHNRDDVIGYSIQSILSQTFGDFELFVVGDGCTDDTEKVVQKFIKQDKRVRWYPFPKGMRFGYEHRNTVLKKAKGDLIAFAAHDDVWFPNHLETMRRFFSSHPGYSIVYSRPLWIHPNGSVLPSYFDVNNPTVHYSFFHLYNGIPATCFVHTRKALHEVHYWNATLPNAADWDLWKRIVLHDSKKRIGFITTPTTAHFRAVWRTGTTSHDEVMKAVYEDVVGVVLNDIRLIQSSHTPQQEMLLTKLGDKKWMDRLTKACEKINKPQFTTLLALIEQNKVLEKQLDEYKNALVKTQNTKVYKIADLLRKLITLPSSLHKSQ